MSHFIVVVRLPAATKAKNLEKVVGSVLDPYCEHTDNGRLARFHDELIDEEDEIRREWENESAEMVRLPDGELVLTWDARFTTLARVVLGRAGFSTDDIIAGMGKEARAKLRELFEYVTVPHRERFATLDAFARDWHGTGRDERSGRLGHRGNPNRKWDYWRIGGRWRGHFFVKSQSRLDVPGERIAEAGLAEAGWEWKPQFHDGPVPGSDTEVDWCRVVDVDFDRAREQARQRTEEFWAQLDSYLAGKDDWEPGEGPRVAMMRVGMMDCRDSEELRERPVRGHEFRVHNCGNVAEYPRVDVIERKPVREEWDSALLAHFNPLRPYAYVEGAPEHRIGPYVKLYAELWRENGELFGARAVGAVQKYDADYMAWLRGGDADDWVVAVDCHS